MNTNTTEKKLEVARKYIDLLKREKQEFLRVRDLAEKRIASQKIEIQKLNDKLQIFRDRILETETNLSQVKKLSKKELLELRKSEEITRLKNNIKNLNNKLKTLKREKESLIIRLNQKQN